MFNDVINDDVGGASDADDVVHESLPPPPHNNRHPEGRQEEHPLQAHPDQVRPEVSELHPEDAQEASEVGFLMKKKSAIIFNILKIMFEYVRKKQTKAESVLKSSTERCCSKSLSYAVDCK